MGTAIRIEEDVLRRAKAVAAKTRTPLRQVVNEALRAGLPQAEEPARQRPYRTVPHAMKLRPGLSLDNIEELLSKVEGEDHR